tara:strand:- start:11490 stop:11984 length:495 start_codon:yes stop_codon:yes gene_type:complete
MTEEMVHIVNEQDEVIDTVPRSVMRAKKLRHRVIRVFIFNSKGQIFVHQRTYEKDLYPGHLDTSIAGTVTTVDYDVEAVRELDEEVGIKNVDMENLFMFKSTDTQSFCKVFRCIYDGELTLQKEEIVWGKFMNIEELKELIKKEKFHPSGVKAFEVYLEKYETT